MKKLLLFLLLLSCSTLSGQGLEQRKSDPSVKVLSVPLNNSTSKVNPVIIDVIDRLSLEMKIRDSLERVIRKGLETDLASAATACDERQLAIDKMKLEIECRGITPDELGIAPDTVCTGLGLYSEWTVRAISRTRIGGTYTALLDPSTPLTTPGPTGTRRERAIVGFDKFIPVGTVIIMAEK